MYIEISPRGSGKTRRLMKALEVYLNEDSSYIAIIYSQTERTVNYIKSKLPEKSSRIFWAAKSYPKSMYVRRFFEEFDHLDLTEKDIFEDAYYCTSLKKFRTLEDVDTDDFLLKLIKTNEYIYSTSLACPLVLDTTVMEEAIENGTINSPEYSTQIFKY